MNSSHLARYALFVAPSRSVASYLYYCRCRDELDFLDAVQFIARIRDKRPTLRLPVRVLATLFYNLGNLN